MKRIISMILTVVIAFAFCSTAFASDLSKEAHINNTNANQDVIDLGDGITVVTTIISESDEVLGVTRSNPERQKTKTFEHEIKVDGIKAAVLTTTVTGIYSQVAGDAYITSIKGTFTGKQAGRFFYNPDISGDTAKLFVFYDAIYRKTFIYKIYTNGNIQLQRVV